jgi:hypothetical protein
MPSRLRQGEAAHVKCRAGRGLRIDAENFVAVEKSLTKHLGWLEYTIGSSDRSAVGREFFPQ